MESIKYVNSVVSFNSDEELEKRIKEWDSELMVIGNDYIPTQIIGFHLFKKVLFFNKLDGKSTTKILSSFL
jgi:bifunctional ADP-heptose synthase (sugar kinase/adenylyltransferase)